MNLLGKILILIQYSNYINIFLLKFIVKFLKNSNNDKTIEIEKGKQLFYNLIYSLKLIKLKILNTYIETNLTNSFIQLFKSLVYAPILFNQKKNSGFCLCFNY